MNRVVGSLLLGFLALQVFGQEEINYLRHLSYAEPEPLPAAINSPTKEIYPVVSPDGQTIYFTRQINKGPQNIWSSDKQANGTWSVARALGKPINGEGHVSLVNIPNDNTLILWDGPSGHIGLTLSKRTADGWSNPQTFYQYKLTHPSYGNMVVGNDLQTILFTIKGDLLVTFREENEEWSIPLDLGSTINTPGPDDVTFLASDNLTLYFVSQGYPGFGGYDLFVTRRLDDTWQNWSEPINLGPGINSKYDEHGLFLPAIGDYAYFTKKQGDQSTGDIYRIKLPKELSPQPVALVKGQLTNLQSGEPVGTEVIYTDLESDRIMGRSFSNPKTGEYEVILPVGKKYGFYAEKNNFYPISKNIDLTEVEKFGEFHFDLSIAPLDTGLQIRLNNLFFPVNSYELESTSYDELNRLVELLQDHGDLIIQINGHTDNTGSTAVNQVLSEQRAQSVFDYLVSQGVWESRLKVKGFGEKSPLSENTTPEGRQNNRRVEFEVIK